MSTFLFFWAACSEFGALIAVFQIGDGDGYGAAIATVALGLQAIISFGFGAVVYTLNKRKAEQEAAAPANA